jgi:hypothetical protein
MKADGTDERGLVHSICGRSVHLPQISALYWRSGRLRRLPVSYGIKKSGWTAKESLNKPHRQKVREPFSMA